MRTTSRKAETAACFSFVFQIGQSQIIMGISVILVELHRPVILHYGKFNLVQSEVHFAEIHPGTGVFGAIANDRAQIESALGKSPLPK